jgi:hypothetical protein
MAINRCMVGVSGAGITILAPPRRPMSKAEAVELAAWLLVLAGADIDKDLRPVVAEVEGT